MATMMSFHAEKFCHLVSADGASVSSWSILHSFLCYFILHCLIGAAIWSKWWKAIYLTREKSNSFKRIVILWTNPLYGI